MVAVETVVADLTCRRCGNHFAGLMIKYDGKLLFPQQHCPGCQVELAAAQHAEDERCKAEKRSQRWTIICDAEFRLPSESGGNTDLQRLDAEQPTWRRILNWSYGQRGLIVFGETGTCKTRAMWRLLRREFDAGRNLAAITGAEFDRRCRDAAGNFTLTAWFEDLARIPILFIDDLGKSGWTEHTTATFHDLVDKRSRKGRPFLITTNFDAENLRRRVRDDFADSLLRRLNDFCDKETFAGKWIIRIPGMQSGIVGA